MADAMVEELSLVSHAMTIILTCYVCSTFGTLNSNSGLIYYMYPSYDGSICLCMTVL